MNPCFPVLCAGNQSDFSAYRTHYSLDNLTKQRAALSRSANQLEQLVSKQGNEECVNDFETPRARNYCSKCSV